MSTESNSSDDAPVAAFVASDSRFRVDSHQPDYRGGTNRCTFGTRDGIPIVYKAFRHAERQRQELACLRHFAASGLVPTIVAEQDGSLIIMERLEGHDGADPDLEPAQRRDLSAAFGRALGRIASMPLPPMTPEYHPVRDFSIIPWDIVPSRAVRRYTDHARRVAASVPACQGGYGKASLDRMERAAELVAGEPAMLYHEDIANFRSDRERFIGIYDLEMCRIGTPSLQLGVALDLCTGGQLDWAALRAGFSECCALPHPEAFASMGHLYHWIRICRWGWWDGDPSQQHHLQDALRDAPWHLERMAAQDSLLASI